MTTLIDITGQKFGRLTVIRRCGTAKMAMPSGCVSVAVAIRPKLIRTRCGMGEQEAVGV